MRAGRHSVGRHARADKPAMRGRTVPPAGESAKRAFRYTALPSGWVRMRAPTTHRWSAMKFLLMVYTDPVLLDALPESEYDRLMKGCIEKADELRAAGVLLDASSELSLELVAAALDGLE